MSNSISDSSSIQSSTSNLIVTWRKCDYSDTYEMTVRRGSKWFTRRYSRAVFEDSKEYVLESIQAHLKQAIRDIDNKYELDEVTLHEITLFIGKITNGQEGDFILNPPQELAAASSLYHFETMASGITSIPIYGNPYLGATVDFIGNYNPHEDHDALKEEIERLKKELAERDEIKLRPYEHEKLKRNIDI